MTWDVWGILARWQGTAGMQIRGNQMQRYASRLLLSLALAGLLAGCGEEPADVPEQIRPIRTFTVTEVASGQMRRFSGIVEASDSSSLSFQVGGTVLEVLVNQGDQVTQGQVLAELDREPYELNVKAAEAELERARAFESQKIAEFERQRTLYEQGWVARVRFDNAERDYRSARSQVSYAVARLNLAKRDLGNTTLVAPFDGTISARSVDPFVEVPVGRELFQIDAVGGFEVAFGVPETSISQIVLGTPATAVFPQFASPVEAFVTEVGSAVGAGSTFPVKAALLEPPPGIRSGMTAEVSLLLAREDESQIGYLVPLTAIAAGNDTGGGFVFVYDFETSTVRRTAIEPAATLQSNMIAVKGVSAGEILASAGVNFLIDGQRVELLEPAASATGS